MLFRHNEQSVRVVDKLEKGGRGLNLSIEVMDGMRCHTDHLRAMTPEGRIVSLADRIAYVCHDIDDAERGGLLCEERLPKGPCELLGSSSSQRIATMVHDVVYTSAREGDIAMSGAIYGALMELRAYLRSIKSVIGATLDQVTVSIGAAVYPDDAADYNDVFMVADYCLYLAKDKGRNRYIIHTLAKHPSVDEIRKIQMEGERSLIKGRDDLSLGEVLVQMRFQTRYGKQPPLAMLLNEFASRANIPLISLWRRDDRSLAAAGGKEKQDVDALHKYFENHSPEELWIPRYVCDGMCVVNTVDNPEEGYPEVREPLTACGVGSYIYIPFNDPDGIPAALIFAVVHRKVFWNEQQYMHFRLFADMIAGCRIHPDTDDKRYRFSEEARAALECLQQPLAVYQVIDGQLNTLIVSDGFCHLLGYQDRAQAVYDMDHHMYTRTHPDDKQRIVDAAARYAAGGDTYDVVFRTRAGISAALPASPLACSHSAALP